MDDRPACPSQRPTTTDSTGRFSLLVDQPATQITVYHSALDDIGLGALVAERLENRGNWNNARLSTPSLLTLWPRLCDSKRPVGTRSAVLMGTARLADNRTRVSGARVLVQWAPVVAGRSKALKTLEVLTDSIGNFIACGVEEYVEPSLLAQSREAQSGVIRLPASVRSVRRVDLVLAEGDAGLATTTVRGRVTSEQGQPLAGISVAVEGRAGEVVSSATGVFVLDSVPFGSRMLNDRAIGYTPVAQAIDVTRDGMPPITIPLSTTIELEAVTVTERTALRLNRSEFDQRRRAGFAQFVDSTAFARVPFIRMGIQMLPNVRVVATIGSEFAIRGRNGCPAHIYLDGTLSNGQEVNRLPLESIAAVEAYSSVAFAPARFIRVMADNCAVVIFWTKWGLRP